MTTISHPGANPRGARIDFYYHIEIPNTSPEVPLSRKRVELCVVYEITNRPAHTARHETDFGCLSDTTTLTNKTPSPSIAKTEVLTTSEVICRELVNYGTGWVYVICLLRLMYDVGLSRIICLYCILKTELFHFSWFTESS